MPAPTHSPAAAPKRRRRAAPIAAVLLLGCALGLAGCSKDQAPVTVKVAGEEDTTESAESQPLQLPATRNTSRVGGADEVTDAAAVAIATHAPSPTTKPPRAAVLIPADDWQAGIAASVLAGGKLRAPILLSTDSGVPEATTSALTLLGPTGGNGPDRPAIYTIGGVAAPGGTTTKEISDADTDPATLAASIDTLQEGLAGEASEHVLIASGEHPEYAMPAAAWAARSGDPVLFVNRHDVPDATRAALRRHAGSAVYVLGPKSVISAGTFKQVVAVAPGAQRIGAEGAVENAIAFARYADGSFGWNINDPGHGLTIANTSRPMNAAAAASLAATGTFAALLLTDRVNSVPLALEEFMLDIKPGYEDDPTRAVYNHVWLIGDETAISAAMQAELDDLAELIKIATPESISGLPSGPAPPESEPTGKSGGKSKSKAKSKKEKQQ